MAQTLRFESIWFLCKSFESNRLQTNIHTYARISSSTHSKFLEWIYYVEWWMALVIPMEKSTAWILNGPCYVLAIGRTMTGLYQLNWKDQQTFKVIFHKLCYFTSLTQFGYHFYIFHLPHISCICMGNRLHIDSRQSQEIHHTMPIMHATQVI